MQYLVTGGTGFIGSALVRRLVKSGHRVRVLDNNTRGIPERLHGLGEQVDVWEGDIRNPETVTKACEGVERVVHLASINGTEFFYSQPDLVLAVGVRGMMNVIDGCRTHGVKELFLASTSEVYQTPPHIPTDETVPLSIPDPLNPRYSYAGAKIISELLTINFGRNYFDRAVIFRPHNVYGPDMGWEHVIPQFVVRMKQATEQSREGTIHFSIQGTGKETRSFVYIDDFIDGLLLVLEKGEHLSIYHIGTSDEIAIKELAIMVGKYFGRDIEIVPGERTEGSTERRCPDISRMRTLGFSPRIRFSTGLDLTAEWYVKNEFKNPHRKEGV